LGALAHLPALRGDYFPLLSRETGRTYHIYVRLPEGYDPAKRYPVVYVLDGDSLFPILAASHLFIALDDKLPEAIVVGIAYGSFDPAVNKRNIDFAPPDSGLTKAEAGAPMFARFLRRELLPRIETRFSADPARRILFGQSAGARFVLYSAFIEPDIFWGRIASNPSFAVGRDLFFGTPALPIRRDLSLVVASGTENNPKGRADALQWFDAWEHRTDAPWAVRPVTLQGGTHAANAGDAYRAGLRLLFNGDR
jgi:predicted alpha/beta superfamily hydrolase